MATGRPVRILGALVVLLALIFVFVGMPYLAAERRVRAFCAQIEPGALWPALAMAAGAQGLKVLAPKGAATAKVSDGSAFARFSCRIRIGPDDRVLSASFEA